MKTLRLLLIISTLIAVSGLNQALSQWSYNGIDIYNTNAGNVGIGNDTPGTLLYVAKNMGEPTITIRNLGGGGGSTYSMVDDLSGADWKFKATTYGGFKIRDHANSLDVITIEPNSAANVLYINADGNLGIGKNTPQSKLDVSADAMINGVRIGRGSNDRSTNTAAGADALHSNTTGEYNTAVGYYALFDNTEGADNTANGYRALNSNISGDNNCALGSRALNQNTSGSNNIAIGSSSLMFNSISNDNTAVGYSALRSNYANYNTAIGSMALFSNVRSQRNVAIGYKAMYNLDFTNSSINYYANNIAIGYEALYNTNPTSSSNGINNNAMGYNALHNNTTGYGNTAIGHSTLSAITEGFFNTAVGYVALNDLEVGSYNTAIGYNAGPTSATSLTNTTAIGKNATVTASNQVVLGNDDITAFYCKGAYEGIVGGTNRDLFADNNGKIGYASSSARYKENITDMESVDWLYKLRPVNFTYKTDENNTHKYGLIAEEVEKVKPEFVSYDDQGRPETVSYSSLISPLLKAVQEQQAMIEELQKVNEVLQHRISSLEAELVRGR